MCCASLFCHRELLCFGAVGLAYMRFSHLGSPTDLSESRGSLALLSLTKCCYTPVHKFTSGE